MDADCRRREICENGLCIVDTTTGGSASAAAGDAGVAGSVSVGGSVGVGGTGSAGGPTCNPGTRSCDGSSVRVCADDGTSRIDTTCSLSQVCSDGACHAIACVPGSTFCKDGQVMQCSDDGTSSTVSKKCDSGQFCVEQDGAADCSATLCTPGAGLCVDSVATSCKMDGSGPAPGGQDCAANKQVCNAGMCADTTCTPGEKLCQHDDVYLCIGGGTDAVLFTACNTNEVCDPNQVACRNRICEPGKQGCDSSRVATCNDLGTGWDQSGTDCTTSNQICVDGACQDPVCVANSTYCQDSNVYTCDANGTSSKLTQTCGYYYHCLAYGTNMAYCAYNACTPGAAVCNGNIATKCNDDGSGYASGGTDCGTDQLCSAGTCKTKVCTPYSYFCANGDVNYCQDGLSSYVLTDCGADARCVKSTTANSASCVPYDCSPGLKACMGNQLGVCADDGTSLASVTTDCNTTSQVCSSTTACADSAVDTLGVAEELQSLSSDYFFGDVIDVESNRNLTLIEANMVLASARDLRFVVYENVNGSYVARFDQVVKDVSNNGYASSGAFSYTIKAGRRYLIGVAVTGGGFVPYYDSLPWQSVASFGGVRGGLATAYATSIYASAPSTDRIYDLRLTSSLP